MTWREFWDGAHSIYVSDRHRALHYDGIARDIVALIDRPGMVAMDYGCGEALSSDRVAAAVDRLLLYDAAPSVREKLRHRFGGLANVAILDETGLAAVPASACDLIIVNSLLQYLSIAEFGDLLTFCRERLKPDGRLVVADVIPPKVGPITDIAALLSFAWRGGFLLAALRGLLATLFSDYRRLRGQLGLTHYAAGEFEALAAGRGFAAVRQSRNIGHNQARMCFELRPTA